MPAPRTAQELTTMHLGTGYHRQALNLLDRYCPEAEQERGFSVVVGSAILSGRADFLYRDLRTRERILVDLKTISPFVWSKLRALKDSPFYIPMPENRRQLLLYLWALEQVNNQKIDIGTIYYVNRADGQRRSAPVLWDAVARYDVEQLLDTIRKGSAALAQGQLPEPSVESPSVCGHYCTHCHQCDHGQRFARGEIKAIKPHRPRSVYMAAKRQAEARRQRLIELGVIQGTLIGEKAYADLARVKKQKPREEIPSLPTEYCSDDGGKMELYENSKTHERGLRCISCGGVVYFKHD